MFWGFKGKGQRCTWKKLQLKNVNCRINVYLIRYEHGSTWDNNDNYYDDQRCGAKGKVLFSGLIWDFKI